MELMFSEIKEQRKPIANLMRHLARVIDGQLREPLVPERQDRAAFHRYARLAVHLVFALDHDRRLTARGIDIPEFVILGDEEIIAPGLVQQRRSRQQGLT